MNCDLNGFICSVLISLLLLQDIKKNLKKYSAQFDIKDRMTLSKASKVSLFKIKQNEYLQLNNVIKGK